jgi:hypothetical protein
MIVDANASDIKDLDKWHMAFDTVALRDHVLGARTILIPCLMAAHTRGPNARARRLVIEGAVRVVTSRALQRLRACLQGRRETDRAQHALYLTHEGHVLILSLGEIDRPLSEEVYAGRRQAARAGERDARITLQVAARTE